MTDSDLKNLETVVIGGGPGGYAAAIRAAQLGQNVTLIEREYIGGVCLNVGCIPSKALIQAGNEYQQLLNSAVPGLSAQKINVDFNQIQQWKDKQVVNTLVNGIRWLLEKNKVKIIEGEAAFENSNILAVKNSNEIQRYYFKNAILATGSHPIELKNIPFGGRVLDSTGLLNLSEIPEKLIIVGGGVIGSELGTAYANLGSKVSILEGSSQIMPNFEKSMIKPVLKRFKQKDVTVICKSSVYKVEEHNEGVYVSFEVNGTREKLEGDYVMIAVGRRPNTDEIGLEKAGIEVTEHGLVVVDKQGRTSNPSVFAIGDIVPGAALAHKASYEGKIAAAAIAGKSEEINYKGIPAVAFTEPELASVGITQQQVKADDIKVNVSRFPLSANGRALTLNKPEGFIQLISREDNHEIIGAQIVGVNASELIAELGVVIEEQLSLEELSKTIHFHPSLNEAIIDTVELALGMPIHL